MLMHDEFNPNVARYKRLCYKRFNIIGSNYLFAAWGLVMHLILLWGVLDANFHSPIIQGLPNVPGLSNAPAKRLVLFVADGLRFRTFIDSPPDFLRDVMMNRGTWGVSHTRMPTESRPGIVAICAGLYEDPSAIFKGWKENPVDFDSIFNQSRFSWAWGSPDIIPIFTKGTSLGNIRGYSYPAEWQNFDITHGQIWRLDSWVFDKYIDWLREEARKVKDTERVVLFLHLLGCDTTGHAAKPYSKEYVDNMNYVDRKIKGVVQMTEEFFGDNATAYIFTSDHGMTDWGSHGSGSTDETETPFIAWGAGIGAQNIRQDVEQVDVTPLISSLIGAPIPANNEGVLPYHYLNASSIKYVNRALFNNLKQLNFQVKAMREMSCEDRRHVDRREQVIDKKISDLNKYVETVIPDESLNEIVDTIKSAKDVLKFYRQYQRTQFLIYLSIMWIGWIIMLFMKMTCVKRSSVHYGYVFFADVLLFSTTILIPAMYKITGCNSWRLPIYALFAIFSFWQVIRSALVYSVKLELYNTKYYRLIMTAIVSLLGVMFVGLTYRPVLSIGMLCSVFAHKVLLQNSLSLFLWTALCLSAFPLLPVVEPYPRIYIVLSSICVATATVTLKWQSKFRKIIEIFRLATTGLIHLEFIDGRSWVSWAILLTTPLDIFTYSTQLKTRMQGIILGLFCPLVLLSASYEPLFFLVFACHLYCWPQATAVQINQSSRKSLTIEELLKAAIFMFYTLLCFFGTGNMASISSFDPSWTRHFVTVFSPFTMFLLIIFKISVPLMLIGCTGHTLGTTNIFSGVLLLGDCLSLPLMYYVTPEGSWLDIGSAISRFTIAMSLPCLIVLLHFLSYPLVTFSPNKFKFYVHLQKKHIV